MASFDPATLQTVAAEAAAAGGRAALGFFRSPDLAAHDKGGGRPLNVVTEGDLASQRKILAVLAEQRPDDAVIAEEEGYDASGVSGVQWYVDPIDSTAN